MNILYQVRAGFVAQGTSLNAWCKANGEDPSHVTKTLIGTSKGKKGLAQREKALAASKAQL